MSIVTSKDGSQISFDKIGSGPAIILINGAMSFRAADPTLGQVAELLSDQFTVYNYDRRGRGDSSDAGDVKSFTKEREIEDVQALIEDAGGIVMLCGFSSGSGLALETAAVTPSVSKVAVYEVPFIVDASREPLKDYAEHTAKLAAEGKREELVEYFLKTVVGSGFLEKVMGTTADQLIAGMKQDRGTWEGMKALAMTLPYDAAFVGKFMKGKPLSVAYWSKVKVPVLVMDGGASPIWFRTTANALAEVLPQASRQTLEGQTHNIDPAMLAPALSEFFKK